MTDHADTVISGRVATLSGESGWGWQQGVAIADGRVIAVGGESELESLADSSTKELRIPDGHIAMPGITDAHLHLMELVLGEAHIDLNGMNLAAVLAAIALEDRQRRLGGDDDSWLLGHGWSMNDLGGWPDAEMLELVAPNRPVALWAHDHHSRWVSHAAMRLSDVEGPRGESYGALVRRDADGRATGVLNEGAAVLPDAAIPDPPHDVLVEWLSAVARRLAALGLTGCHDPGLLNADPQMQRGPLFFRGLAEEGTLPLRVSASIRSAQIDRAREIGWRSGQRVGRYSSGWLKMFADGSLGSRTAALLEPYLDQDIRPPTGGPRGMVVTDAGELADLLTRAAEIGVVGQIHAIGDDAVRMALDVFAAMPRVDSPLKRRIEHAQLVDPIDQPRFGALGVAASVQPVHLRSDAVQERDAWGIRAEESFPLRSMVQGGALIPFGTDAPVEPPDPWPGIAVAICRRDPFDAESAPIGADHAITLERAIRAACVDPAVVAGCQDLGRLVPGALADLIVVPDVVTNEEADPAELASVRPLATFIDGELIHGGL